MVKPNYNNLPTDFSLIHECRLCKSTKLVTMLDFGQVPLANSYPKTVDTEEGFYPLSVTKCDNCQHVQLRETINPETLFSDYSYASSDSPSLITHFREFASTVTTKLGLGEHDNILEIGCNDGILLKEFVKLGFINLYGVEPAANIAERAVGLGAVILNKFFDTHTAKQIQVAHGHMDIICANNVFAHVADIDSMIQGIANLLTPDGVFIFENAYLLDTIKGLYFDQVYHEHLQYYGIRPLVTYLAKYGLEIFDIERVITQGGSFRIYAQLLKTGKHTTQPSVSTFLQAEEAYGLYEFKTYTDFNHKIAELADRVKAIVKFAQTDKKTVSCYGCPAKFALFSKVFGLTQQNIKYVVDDSPLKQGCFSPGKKIPIVNREHFISNPTDYCLVAVWNMADAVIARNPQYKGKWIIPMPNFDIKQMV